MGCAVCTCAQERRPRGGAGVGGSQGDALESVEQRGEPLVDLRGAVKIEKAGGSTRSRCAASRGAV
jgi:hypothetical protein